MLQISPIFNAMMRNKSSVMLIIIQIALTVAIVSNASYIITERIQHMQRETGLPEEQLIAFNMFFFDSDVDITEQLALDAIKLRELPGVINATAANQVPLSGNGDSWSFRDKYEVDGAKDGGATVFYGDENLVDVLGINISRGRSFTNDEVIYERDGIRTPSVIIVTQAMADYYFPDQDALGKTIYNMDNPLQIVGIIDQMQGPWLSSAMVERSAIMPLVTAPTFKRFIIRAEPNAVDRIVTEIEDVLLGLENRRVVQVAQTLVDMKADSYQADRLMTGMLVVIISILVFITTLGISGMAVFNVNRRRKQIGTRRALGASKANILSYFMTESAIFSGIGIVIGVALAFVLNNFLMDYMSSSALSVSFIVGTIVGVVVISQIAVFIPARKAASISPAIATRSV
ncbi:ABC transporter permease [Thalassotalea fusca]